MNKCMKEKVQTTTPDTGYPAEIGYISVSFTFVSNFTFINEMLELYYLFSQDYTYITRMHSSRMRTIRCSDRRGGGACIPACTGQEGCVSQHALDGGVCIPACIGKGGVCPGGCVCRGVVCLGVSAWDVCLGGVCTGVVCHTPPPCGQNDRRL